MKTNVVYVNFGARGEYPYLNDKFDLAVGDKVYVDGKLAGILGTVTEVLTRFKVSLKYYKYVLEKVDFSIKGTFRKMSNYYSAAEALPFEQASAWMKAPEAVGKDETEEVFVYGDGYEIDLDRFADGEYDDIPGLDEETCWDGEEIVDEGCLKILTVSGGRGMALIQGEKSVQTVDFNFDAENRRMTDVYCDCICPRLCEDMAAVACLLSKALAQTEVPIGSGFTLIEQNLFDRLTAEKPRTVIV